MVKYHMPLNEEYIFLGAVTYILKDYQDKAMYMKNKKVCLLILWKVDYCLRIINK